MAYIVSNVSSNSGTSTTFSPTLSAHATDDVIFVCLTNDSNTATTITTASSGWNIIGSQASSGGIKGIWAYKVAASSSETSPTFSGSTTPGTWIGQCVVVRDVEVVAGTPTLLSSRQDWNNASSFTNAALNTNTPTNLGSNVLLLYSFHSDGTSTFYNTLSELHMLNSTAVTSILCRVGYILQQSSGAVPTATGYHEIATEGGNVWVIAIKNKSNGGVQPYLASGLTVFDGLSRIDVQNSSTFGTPYACTASTATNVVSCAGHPFVDGDYVTFLSHTPTAGVNDYVGYTVINSVANTSFKLSKYTGGSAISITADITSGSVATCSYWNTPSYLAASINGITCSSTHCFYTTTSVAALIGVSWGYGTQIDSGEASTAWVGVSRAVTSVDLTNQIFHMQWSTGALSSRNGADGWIVVFGDGTNWCAYQLAPYVSANPIIIAGTLYTSYIALGNATTYANSGNVNWAAVTRFGIMWHRTSAVTTAGTMTVKRAVCFSPTLNLVGGNSSNYLRMRTPKLLLDGYELYDEVTVQGNSQIINRLPLRIGNGTTPTYMKFSSSAYENPTTRDTTTWSTTQANYGTYAVPIDIYCSASDTIDFRSSVISSSQLNNFTINSNSSTSASYLTSGSSIIGWKVTWKTGVPCTGISFTGCDEVDAKGATVSGCYLSTSVASTAMKLDDGASVIDSTFTKGSDTYAIRIPAAGTYMLTGNTFTGYSTNQWIHVTATTGTVTLKRGYYDAVLQYTSDGATVVDAYADVSLGMTFTSLVAGSQVRIYETGTTTTVKDVASSGTSEVYSATRAPLTVDYTIIKPGYLPIRVVGVLLTTTISIPVYQQIDRTYSASSTLVYNTNATINTGTKKFGITAASTVQNWYSFIIESWKDQASLKNVTCPVIPNGPDSFTLSDGWEWDSQDSIDLLSGDGMRYTSVAGAVAAIWIGASSIGALSGHQVRYLQSSSGAPINTLTTTPFSQLIKVYGDATHGNFDYRSYIIFKCQTDGYYDVEFDAVANYGSLIDSAYVLGLAHTTTGESTGDPSIAGTVTITNHGASPVTWNGKDYSITITDSATGNSGSKILRWLSYNKGLHGTFQGINAFNWPQMVEKNGNVYKTTRGTVINSAGATLKGVRVVKSDGTTPHPAFNLFTADDGTTYTPPLTITADFVLANSRVQLYNITQATEMDNAFVTSSGYSVVAPGGTAASDSLRLRITKIGYVPLELYATYSDVSGASFSGIQVADSVYTSNAIDGATVTEFSLDAPNVQIDVNDPDGVTSVQRIYAWYSYELTTQAGISTIYGAISAVNEVNYKIDQSIADIKFDNVNVTPVSITGGSIYRANDTSIIATGSNSIQITTKNAYVIETPTSGLTVTESAKLAAVPTRNDLIALVG